MNWLRSIRTRFRALFRKRELDADMDDELRSHIEMRTQANIEAGMNPEEARFAALRQFGWTESIKETCRDQRGVTWLENLVQDIRYGARQLRKNPGFTAVAVLTLALGIGANTAAFGVIDRLMLRPLPVRAPQELARIGSRVETTYYSFDYPLYAHYRDHAGTFSALAAYAAMPVSLTIGGEAERARGLFISENYFTMLGIESALGRTLRIESDAEASAPPVAVISHQLWQRRFGADPSVLGRTISVNRQPFTIIGVTPAEFGGTILGSPPELYLPITRFASVASFDRHVQDPLQSHEMAWVNMLGRLKSGGTREQAQAELRTLTASLENGRRGNTAERIFVEDGGQGHTQGVQRARVPLLLIQAAVGLLLLMACANIAGLLLARSSGRRREMAIRLAVGATRWRLVRQLLIESLLLALLGCGAGLAVAVWINSAVAGIGFPDALPVVKAGLDFRALAFSGVLALFVGTLFGLAASGMAMRPELLPALKQISGGTSGGGSRWALRSVLVVGQIAVCVIVLVSAGLCLRSAQRLYAIAPGYETAKVLTMSFDLSRRGYQAASEQRFLDQLLGKVRSIPGVEAASLAGSVVLGGNSMGVSLNELDGVGSQPGVPVSFRCDVIAPEYFGTLGMPLLRGRDFSAQDTINSVPVAIINDVMARRYWPEQEPVGKQLRLPRFVAPPPAAGVGLGLPNEKELVEIVGVAADGKFGLRDERQPTMYRPVAQIFHPSLSLHVRSSGDTKPLVAAVRREVRALDEHLALFDVRTLEQQKARSVFLQRALATLLSGLGLIGLGLAGLGLYGVIGYSVRQRTAEIGVRMALGAQQRDILSMVLGQGVRLALVGVAIGLAGALAATRLLRAVLFGVIPTDPLTFGIIPVLLIAVATLASWLPARRASRVNPMEALRCE